MTEKLTFPDLVMREIPDVWRELATIILPIPIWTSRFAYFYCGGNIPLVSDIIMPIFDPFSQIATVNLKGTLKKPEWRFAISPLNLFDEKADPAPQEPLEDLLEFEFRK